MGFNFISAMFGGGGKSGSGAPAAARALETQRQNSIQTAVKNIAKSFSGFGTAYYHKRGQEYVNYAMPRLGEQVRDTQKVFNYSLADKGLSHSSVASEGQAALDRSTAEQQNAIVDEGANVANQARLETEDKRNSLIQQAITAQNPNQLAQGVMLGASKYTFPQTSPWLAMLGSMLGGAGGAMGSFGGGSTNYTVKGGK